MALLGQLDPNVAINNNASGGGGFQLLPDDEYELEIIESDVKANSKGTGQNLDFKVQLVGDTSKWFFGGITSVQHTSAQAQTIGQGQLAALCAACGVDYSTLQDSESLHHRPFFARVGSETYFSTKHQKDVSKNVITKYLYEGMPEEDAAPQPPADKPAAQAAPATPAATPATPAAAPGARTWQKRA